MVVGHSRTKVQVSAVEVELQIETQPHSSAGQCLVGVLEPVLDGIGSQ